jgi:hypothetical protein
MGVKPVRPSVSAARRQPGSRLRLEEGCLGGPGDGGTAEGEDPGRPDVPQHAPHRSNRDGLQRFPTASLQRIAGHSSIEITAKCYLNIKPEGHGGTISALALYDDMECKPDANCGVVEATEIAYVYERLEPTGGLEPPTC